VGNFYCNFAVRGPMQEEIAATLRDARRRALVTPAVNGTVIVYDEAVENSYDEEIDKVGELLSKHHDCPVLATTVIDDDELWFRLYQHGIKTVDYSSGSRYSSGPRYGGAGAICRAFGRPVVAPIAWLLLHIPYVVLEVLRHMALARLLRIPNWCVGCGYRDITENDGLPEGLSMEDLASTRANR
jgi:hypothetical protein